MIAFILGFILSFMAHEAFAQGLQHSPYGQHDRYGGIKNRKGEVCCNRQDCRHVVKEQEVNILPEGGYVVRSTSEFVTEEKVADSPDGEWHICREYVMSAGSYVPKGKVRCLMIPVGGS